MAADVSALCLQTIHESGYRELLLDTQMLRQDLEKTLADKQHTMVCACKMLLMQASIVRLRLAMHVKVALREACYQNQLVV